MTARSAKIPVVKGQSYDINIDRLGVNGEGVGNVAGFTVFVPQALQDESVEVTISEVKKTYAVGKLQTIFKKSTERVIPRCNIYADCGGCQLQHMSYKSQLSYKRAQVVDAIERIGKLNGIKVEETLAAPNPWNYRNKVQFPIGRGKEGVIIGCFAQGSHRIIDTDNCHIQMEGNNDIVNAARDIANRLNIPVYNEDRYTGVLRHIVGRVGLNGELMVAIVTATKGLPRGKEFVKMLRTRLPKLVSVQQNIQTYRNNVILGHETKLLWGKPTIKDKIGNLTFNISPRSFFQVNTTQTVNLYNTALDLAALTGKETVIDVYCGTGTITLFLAQRARKVYGIEIVQPAIIDARKNARDNNIKNVEFITGDATKVIPALYKQGIRADIITLDPPRAGCTEIVLQTIVNMKPQRIVYISCNHATLARDLALLCKYGYTAQHVQPVDMFPMTSHVETVALITRTTI